MKQVQTFLVGGAVRDILMGLEPKDRDYVVVGATAQYMLDRGYTQVGADFPVFLHPETHDEYALARLERKTGQGYGGFAVQVEDVTLEEDLSRRDLTINSMAQGQDGAIVDPFGGAADLKARVLRHTSAAFSEDPLRILRVSRFLARLGPDWAVDAGTHAVMKTMVAAGELSHLPPERVWKEISRGLQEKYPELMVGLLQELEVLEHTPDLSEMLYIRPGFREALTEAAQRQEELVVRFCTAFGAKAAPKLPSEVQDLSRLVQQAEKLHWVDFAAWTPVEKLAVLDSWDVLRRPERAELVLRTLSILQGVVAEPVLKAIQAVRGVDQAALARQGGGGQAIRDRVVAAKQAAISAAA